MPARPRWCSARAKWRWRTRPTNTATSSVFASRCRFTRKSSGTGPAPSGRLSLRPSGVAAFKLAMRLPKGTRLDAIQDVGEDAGVHVPAAHDADHEVVRREAPVHDGEQDVLAARRELVGDLGVAAHVPGVGEHAHRLEAGDLAFEFTLALFPVLRRHVLVVRQAGVVELQADRATEAQVELAGGEPLGALVGLGEVGPDALNGARQQALHLHGAGYDHGYGIHFDLLLN